MIGCIVAAAGYGSLPSNSKRPVPKVVEIVRGIPMVVHSLRAAEGVGIENTVVVVNPRDADIVTSAIESALNSGVIHRMPAIVTQPERRGSADAVLRAIPVLRKWGVKTALVTYGDMPQWSIRTLRRLIERSRQHAIVTMTTVERLRDYPTMDRYGRVVRDATGHIQRIVEIDDPAATADVLNIRRVNPSLWVWDLAWLENAIPRITPFKKSDGMGDERYMPPLIAMAVSQGHSTGELALAAYLSREALGVNTAEDFALLSRRE